MLKLAGGGGGGGRRKNGVEGKGEGKGEGKMVGVRGGGGKVGIILTNRLAGTHFYVTNDGVREPCRGAEH